MKKIIPLILTFALIVTVLSSCGKSDAAKAVISQIDAIGDVSLDSLTAIEEAENAYAFLSGEDKGDVNNYEKLQQARKDFDALKAFSDKATLLIEKYDKVFTEYGISLKELLDEKAALEEEMNASSGKIKEQYGEMLAPVSEKEKAFSEITEKAYKSAVSYIKGFYEIHKDNKDNIEIKELGCIGQVSDDVTYFLFAASYTENGTEKKVYAKARFANAPTVESMVKYADNFYTDAPASEKTDALSKGNISLDLTQVLQGIS